MIKKRTLAGLGTVTKLWMLVHRYLVRPNAGQVEWAANYFRDNLVRIKADGSRDEAFNATTQAPPQEAICIHVRHGDKGAEMTYVSSPHHIPSLTEDRSNAAPRKPSSLILPLITCRLHPWEDYMAAAQELVAKQEASPNIFLTTDDAGVIDKVRPRESRSTSEWHVRSVVFRQDI
jgi:hypothetical protein